MSEFTTGLDVSKWQGAVSYRGVDVDWVVAKATHGESGVDSMFARNRSEIRDAGFSFGAYHWFLPSHDPLKQAQHFVSTVGELTDKDIGLAIDVEDASGRTGAQILDALLTHVREVIRLTGRRPLIYTADWFWAQHIGLDSPELAACPLWVAQYPSTQPDRRPFRQAVAELKGSPRIPLPWARRGILETAWQFDGDGGLRLENGVDVDVNRMRGSVSRLVESTRVDGLWTEGFCSDPERMQRALVTLGYDVGGIDGKVGAKTQAAIARYCEANELLPHEYMDHLNVRYVMQVGRRLAESIV
jgi:Glycosyl hydrolases family 25